LQWRDNLKCVNNGKKIEAIHDDQNRTMIAAQWWRDGLRATGLQWLQNTSYNQFDHGLCSAFAERWHMEASSFHLPFGEMRVTLDDVSFFLHLPIDGMLMSHESMTRAETVQMMVEHLGADAGDAWKEVIDTKGRHAQFNELKRIFKEHLLEQQEAFNEEKGL
jgi:hypothetical protein